MNKIPFKPYIHMHEKNFNAFGYYYVGNNNNTSFSDNEKGTLKSLNDKLFKIYNDKKDMIKNSIPNKKDIESLVEQYNKMIDTVENIKSKKVVINEEDKKYQNLYNKIQESIKEKFFLKGAAENLLSLSGDNKDAIINQSFSGKTAKTYKEEIEGQNIIITWNARYLLRYNQIQDFFGKSPILLDKINSFLNGNNDDVKERKKDLEYINKRFKKFLETQDLSNEEKKLLQDFVNGKDQSKTIFPEINEGIIAEQVFLAFTKNYNSKLKTSSLGQVPGIEYDNVSEAILKQLKSASIKIDLKIDGYNISMKNWDLKKDDSYKKNALPKMNFLILENMIEGQLKEEKMRALFLNAIVNEGQDETFWKNFRGIILLENLAGAFQKSGAVNMFLVRNKNSGKLKLEEINDNTINKISGYRSSIFKYDGKFLFKSIKLEENNLEQNYIDKRNKIISSYKLSSYFKFIQ